jgi:hypothetical protein
MEHSDLTEFADMADFNPDSYREDLNSDMSE